MSLQKPRWAVWQSKNRARVLEVVLLSMDLDPHTVLVDGIDTVSRDLGAVQRAEYQRRQKEIVGLLSPHGPLTNHSSMATARSYVDLKETVGFMVKLGLCVPNEFQAILQKDDSVVSGAWEGFDEDSPMYPRLLDIACLAHRAVTNNPDDLGTPKERITRWLAKSYPKLSINAKKQIAAVCNWDSNPGRRTKK